jgi:predicted nuclease of restriction endonuclease-like (RecB) superfamily
MVNDLVIKDEQYRKWVADLRDRYQISQIKAATAVNSEMLKFYWSLGRDIVAMGAENMYGSNFYGTLSHDMQAVLPDAKGFSVTNLKYMRRFYELYPNRPQVADDLLLADSDENHPQLADDSVTSQLEDIFMVPWGHHRVILDKCKSDSEKARFYVHQTLANNWSRAVLLNWLDTNLYERQGKAITNFELTLPAPQSDLAQEMTRDPYNFDFLTIRAQYDEKELKDALISNVQRLLMELGSGFAFVGREYRLVVGQTEQFIDLLFYNYQLHCFVVVEVKVSDFDPRDMGQLSTYVAAVDGIMRKEQDQPTIGLLICKTKDNVLAQYAANVVKAPIGISEYQLSNLLKDEFKGKLPSIEEIERELREE